MGSRPSVLPQLELVEAIEVEIDFTQELEALVGKVLLPTGSNSSWERHAFCGLSEAGEGLTRVGLQLFRLEKERLEAKGWQASIVPMNNNPTLDMAKHWVHLMNLGRVGTRALLAYCNQGYCPEGLILTLQQYRSPDGYTSASAVEVRSGERMQLSMVPTPEIFWDWDPPDLYILAALEPYFSKIGYPLY